MNTAIRTLKIVVDCVQRRYDYLTEADLTTEIEVIARQAAETAAGEVDGVDPESVGDLLLDVVSDAEFAARLDGIDANDEPIEDELRPLAEALARRWEASAADESGSASADESGSVSADEIDWSAVATASIEALKPDLVAVDADDRDGEGRLQDLGATALQYGDFDVAEEYLEVSRNIGRDLDDEAARMTTLVRLGDGALRYGNPDVAAEYYQLALELATEREDSATEAECLAGLGNVALQENDLDRAEAHLQESLEITRETGDRSAEANSLASLGTVAGSRGEFDTAEAYLSESLDLKRLADDTAGEAATLASLGSLAESRGDYETAVDRYTEALERFTSVSRPRERLQTLQALAAAEFERGNEQLAADRCEEGLELLADSEFVGEGDHHQWFRTTRARVTGNAEDLEAAYETALRRVDEEDAAAAAFDLLSNVWDCRAAFDPGTDGHIVTLRAGAGLATYYLLLESDDIEGSPEAIIEEIDSYEKSLSEPAATLVAFVRSGGSDRDLEIDTEVEEADPLDDLERSVYAGFLDRISETPPASKLYTTALTRVVEEGDIQEIVELSLTAWDQRDDDSSEDSEDGEDDSRPVLGAGLLVEACREAFGISVPTDREAVFDTLSEHRSALSEPMATLFDHLATGSADVTPETLLEEADEEQPSLTDVERMVAARFLDQIDG